MYVNPSWLVVKIKGQSSIFRSLKTFTTQCYYISSWPWPLNLTLISIIASCFFALRLVVFIFLIFRDCDFKKKKIVFCRFASICNTENIREGQSQLLGPFRQWSKKHQCFFELCLKGPRSCDCVKVSYMQVSQFLISSDSKVSAVRVNSFETCCVSRTQG